MRAVSTLQEFDLDYVVGGEEAAKLARFAARAGFRLQLDEEKMEGPDRRKFAQATLRRNQPAGLVQNIANTALLAAIAEGANPARALEDARQLLEKAGINPDNKVSAEAYAEEK